MKVHGPKHEDMLWSMGCIGGAGGASDGDLQEETEKSRPS